MILPANIAIFKSSNGKALNEVNHQILKSAFTTLPGALHA